MIYVMGIDPGKSGGWVMIDTTRRVIQSGKNPASTLAQWNLELPVSTTLVVIERVVAASWSGAQNNSELMRNYGWWEMWAEYYAHASVKYLMPRQWQKVLKIKRTPPKPFSQMTIKEQGIWYQIKKKLNKKRAEKLFPGVEITNYTADAFLLAEVALRLFEGRK